VKHLSSPEGQEALRRLAADHTLFAFDFDGTLAPIVSRPDQARAAIGVRQRLAQLAQRVPVAVISGRSLADLRPRIPSEIRLCVGNHGSEGATEEADAKGMRKVCRAWVAQLNEWLKEPGSDPGIVVEDKGLTLSVHFRLARDRERAAQRLAELVPRLEPAPRVIGGKLVLNLLPPKARTKFEALVELAQREAVGRVLFVGDDETDELVFAQAPKHWTTVRVDLNRASRADFFVHQQSEVAIVLDQLLALVRTPAASAQSGSGDQSGED
jgi:trehalose 6-phosphate phosphatase